MIMITICENNSKIMTYFLFSLERQRSSYLLSLMRFIQTLIRTIKIYFYGIGYYTVFRIIGRDI